MLTEEDKEEIRELALKAKGERAQKEARKSLKEKYDLAKSCVEAKDFQEAKKHYNDIIDELLKKGINIAFCFSSAAARSLQILMLR